MTYTHPMRRAELHVFKRHGNADNGSAWRAQFWPYDTYPIVFSGSTECDATQKAEKFRGDVIVENEASYIRRKEGYEKAREARAAKRIGT